MKTIKLREESDRQGLSIDAVWSSFNQAISLRGSIGFIDSDKDEMIVAEPMEVKSLIEGLKTGSSPLSELAEEYRVSPDEMRLVVGQLIRQEKLDGVVTSNEYLSSNVVRTRLIEVIESGERIDLNEIATKSRLPVETVERFIKGFEGRIIIAVKSYSRVDFMSLSKEVGLPETTSFLLLRRLVSENRLSGSIDSVDGSFIQKPLPMSENIRTYIREEPTSSPSDLWYLLPLFLGLIGGIIGYVSLVERDKEKAKNLMYFGLVITAITSFIWFMNLMSLTRYY